MNHYPYMFNRGFPPPGQGYPMIPPGFVPPPGFIPPVPPNASFPGGYIPPHPNLMGMNQPIPPQSMLNKMNPNIMRNSNGLLVPPQLVGGMNQPLPPHLHQHQLQSQQIQMNNSLGGSGSSIPNNNSNIIISPPQSTISPVVNSSNNNNIITQPATLNSSSSIISSPPIGTGIMTTSSGLASKFSLPVTSVFIGKIPPGVSDEFIKLLIEQCGTFSKWTRGSDASGKLKGFGFCEFNAPEGALRALRLLNDLEIDQGKLSVKVEDKVQNFLNEYIENKKKFSIATAQKLETENNNNTSGINDNNSNIASQVTLEEEEKEKLDDLIVGERIKVLIEKNKSTIEENRKNEPQIEQINTDIYSKDRKDLTKDEKQRVIDREVEKEQIRDRERESKRKEREYRDFKKEEEAWENRERNKDREREKEREKERDRIKYEKYYRINDMEDYSDSDEKLRKRFRSEKAYKLRQREKEEDKLDREKEQEELNQIKQLKLQEQLEREKKLKILDDNLNKIRLKKPIASIASGFNSGMVDDNIIQPNENSNNIFKKKQTFIPLDNDDLNLTIPNNNNSSVEKVVQNRTKEEIRELISKIPTEKEDLLKMKMEWDIIDRLGLIDKEMKPWISTKVSEFMGGVEEPLLNEHIVELLKAHLSPSETISKLSVLEGHAEEFVLKMFRKLAYLEKSS